MSALDEFKKELNDMMEWATADRSINTAECWHVVYFRMKYDHENEWEYLVEPFIWQIDDIDFCMDFWEGQQNIEFLGVYSLKHLVKYYRKEEN